MTAKDKAETLNSFFSSTFTDERLDDIPISPDVPFLGEYLDSLIITPQMVNEKIQDLNPGKSPGPDGWHPIFLKNIADLIITPLSTIFQKSSNEGIVPSQWLVACITAIHKKGLKNLFENYRPVSITSIICKMMESIVRDKIVMHMEKNNLFSPKQHGFVPLRNCMTNLLICMEHWTTMIENGLPIDIIYTDFAKAFDRVPHHRLLQKMKNLGIIGRMGNWIKAFLTGRTQRVRVEEELSSWKSVKSGIPQGSVLGPTLFVIFINDMPDVINSMCQLFADDAKIFSSVKSLDDNKTLQDDINKLTEWSARWQLPFNIAKCKSLHIGKSNNKYVYEMNGQRLEQVTEEKDLGVLIDNELKFHKQTATAIKKANGVLGLIKKSFALLDSVTLTLLYKTLVRPHLEYGNVVWGPYFMEDIKAVERVQRRVTKMLPRLKEMTYEDRLRELNLPSLTHRRRRGDMIFAYKIVTGKMNMNKDDFFKISHLTTRGHPLKIYKQHAKKLPRINTFSNRIVNDWNKLPSKIVQAKSTNSFKNELDKYWSEEMYTF